MPGMHFTFGFGFTDEKRFSGAKRKRQRARKREEIRIEETITECPVSSMTEDFCFNIVITLEAMLSGSQNL